MNSLAVESTLTVHRVVDKATPVSECAKTAEFSYKLLICSFTAVNCVNFLHCTYVVWDCSTAVSSSVFQLANERWSWKDCYEHATLLSSFITFSACSSIVVIVVNSDLLFKRA